MFRRVSSGVEAPLTLRRRIVRFGVGNAHLQEFENILWWATDNGAPLADDDRSLD